MGKAIKDVRVRRRRFLADIPARSTRWRYVVTKTSGAAGAPLSDYVVEPVNGGPPVAEGDPGEFTTPASVAWQYGPPRMRLARLTAPATTTPVMLLPPPGTGTPLVEADGGLLAVLHVYV